MPAVNLLIRHARNVAQDAVTVAVGTVAPDVGAPGSAVNGTQAPKLMDKLKDEFMKELKKIPRKYALKYSLRSSLNPELPKATSVLVAYRVRDLRRSSSRCKEGNRRRRVKYITRRRVTNSVEKIT